MEKYLKIESKVQILDENGNLCGEGLYKGTGIPSQDLNATYRNILHYAVLVEGQMRYYPTGYHTLILAPTNR